jgi:hypothetical protein
MTITLSWWIWPILIVLAGFIYAYIDEKNIFWFLSGINGVLVFILSVFVAIAFTIGHWLA